MHLFSTNSREPFQELVYCRALIEMLKQGGNRGARASETPRSAELTRVSVDSAAATPIHTNSLAVIRWVHRYQFKWPPVTLARAVVPNPVF